MKPSSKPMAYTNGFIADPGERRAETMSIDPRRRSESGSGAPT